MVAVRSAVVLLLAALVAGCAQNPMDRATAPLAPFSHRVESAHVALYWNCEAREAGVLRLDGAAANPLSAQPVQFLEVELVGVDGNERTVSFARVEAPDIQLFTKQITRFGLALRTTGTEARFDIYYQYRFHENGKDEIASNGDLRGLIRPVLLKRFLVRDACSASQHRSPSI
jgi:hypothetical protein